MEEKKKTSYELLVFGILFIGGGLLILLKSVQIAFFYTDRLVISSDWYTAVFESYASAFRWTGLLLIVFGWWLARKSNFEVSSAMFEAGSSKEENADRDNHPDSTAAPNDVHPGYDSK